MVAIPLKGVIDELKELKSDAVTQCTIHQVEEAVKEALNKANCILGAGKENKLSKFMQSKVLARAMVAVAGGNDTAASRAEETQSKLRIISSDTEEVEVANAADKESSVEYRLPTISCPSTDSTEVRVTPDGVKTAAKKFRLVEFDQNWQTNMRTSMHDTSRSKRLVLVYIANGFC